MMGLILKHQNTRPDPKYCGAVDYHYVVLFKYKDQNMWGVLDNGGLRNTLDQNSIPDPRQGGRPFKIINIERD